MRVPHAAVRTIPLLVIGSILAGAAGNATAQRTDPPSARAQGAGPQRSQPPEWIWAAGEPTADRRVVFETTIAASGSVRSASIHGGADFCHLSIFVNDRPAATVDAFADWFTVDLTSAVVAGENRIAIVADPVPGPSAIALRIAVETANGRRIEVDTGKLWTAHPAGGEAGPARRLGRVADEMWTGQRPAAIDPYDDYTQWKRALGGKDPSAFELPEGYQIENLLAASKDQSSWVSMMFDSHGRLLLGREDEGLLRVDLTASPRVAAPVASDVPLKECRGLVLPDSRSAIIYANANNSKALYRLAADGDGLQAALLREFPGSVGHGRNDLAWWQGRDPALYSMHGDAVELPVGDDVVDLTSPLREARQGKATREGHLLRIPAEGIEVGGKLRVETFCAGLRNPFGIAINRDGEKFTYDADAEYDMGAPWYRPTRVVHLVSGADYGWRGVTKQWPPYFPDHADNALPLCTVGKGSPTAAAFGYAADKFPAADREALYVLDWAYGRVLRVHLTPRGAGYRARCETFLRGRPLNVTDIAFHEGSMYLVTGGRKTQSNVYRVSYVGPQEQANRIVSQQAARRAKHGAEAMALRKRLQSAQRPGAKVDDRLAEEIYASLGNADPAIRYAARIALEHMTGGLSGRPAGGTDAITAVTRLTSLARLASEPNANELLLSDVLKQLNQVPWRQLTPSDQLRLLHCDAICLARGGGELRRPETRQCQQRQLAMFRRAAGRVHVHPTGLGRSVDQQALHLLLQQNVAEAVPLAVEQLQLAASQDDEMFLLYVLRNVTNGWTLPLRRTYFEAFRHTRDYLGGDGMPAFIRQIHSEALATLTDEERLALRALIKLDGEDIDPPPPPRKLVRKWQLDALHAVLDQIDRPADVRRGAEVFHQALCSRCHRMGSAGRPVGPELTSVGSRFRRLDLLRSILQPSEVIAEVYRQDDVQLADGRRLTGIASWGGDYRSPTLRLLTNPLRPADVVEVPKGQIDQRRPSTVSPMPAGLLDTFTAEEIQDLLAYLTSGSSTLRVETGR